MQIFNTLAILGFITGLVTGFISIFDQPNVLNVAGTFGTALYSAFAYWRANKTRNYKRYFLFLVIIVFLFSLPLLFFVGGGHTGGVPSFFVLAVVFTVIMLEGRRRLVFTILEIILYAGCFVTEWFFPEIITPFPTETNAFIDVIVGCMASSIVLAIAIYRHIIVYDRVNKSKNIFFATMSHEIRTPMNAIIGISQIQLQRDDMPQEYAEAFEMIYTSGNALLRIINDVLDISRIETNRLELHPTKYDVPSLLSDTTKLNAVHIGFKPIEFMLDIDENLPRSLFGDELRLKQILNNLLSNAFKYTEKGYVKLIVSHQAEDEDVILRFTVKDTGRGINPQDKARLFSEYVRVGVETNRETEGAGLGLRIAKNLVELMDGSVDVESEYGKGSVFTATVKQKAVDSSVIGIEIAQQLRSFSFKRESQFVNSQLSHRSMPQGAVLVVDDVQTNLFVAKGLLEPYGLKIETATSGHEAIEKVRGGAVFDIIFMDHKMPKMDGVEAMKILRKDGYKRPIVALTANAVAGAAEILQISGFDDFISKPIDIQRLDEVLGRFIVE